MLLTAIGGLALFLLGIHKGLRLLFPEDEAVRWSWVKRRNAALAGQRSARRKNVWDGLPKTVLHAIFTKFRTKSTST